MTLPSRGARLRAILHTKEAGRIAIAPGCYDGLSAKLVEAAGFPAAYMSGLCVAATMGEPDVGVLSVDAMVERARLIAASIEIPLIVDADTGYGGAYNVAQATRAFESSGAAAMHLEDQPFPKKCAAMAGKSLVGIPEMVARLRVAVAARRDPDFLILARTDAFAVEGLAPAIERLQAYEQTGVDGTILMSVVTEEDMLKITASLAKPTIVNMVEGLRPLVPLERLGDIGYSLVCYPVSLLQAQVHAQRRMLAALQRDGTTASVAQAATTLNDINDVMSLGNAHRVDSDYARYLAEASAVRRG